MERRAALNISNEWLFVTKSGDEYVQATTDTFNSWANTIGRYCDKPFYWHSMRHLFVSNLVRDGMSDSDIVEVVGWADSSMVQVYNDVPATERLSAFFASKKEKDDA